MSNYIDEPRIRCTPGECWKIARHNRLPIPDWVTTYLDSCADAMDDISRQVGPGRVLNGPRRKRSPKVDVPAALAKGFGFSKGRGYSTAFAEWVEQNEKTLVGGLVAKWMGKTGESLSAAADEIAHKLEISSSTAERAYRSLGVTGRRLRDEAASAARRR